MARLATSALALAAAVAAILLLGLAADVVRLRRVKRGAVSLGSVAVRRARIGLSRTVTTPTAIGYLHPAVVLPDGFRARVDEREWDAVVAHECAHLARRDDWAKAVQSAVLRVGWWIPGLWVLSRALDLERELASDERAACETGPRRYAACLLRLATDRCDAAGLAPALWGRRSHVAIRVERLVRPVAGGGPVVRAVALGAFTAAAIAVVAAAVLAVPGTNAPVAASVPHHADLVLAHAALRHAAPRIAEHIRPAKPAAHAKVFAYARIAAPAAHAAAPAPRIVATVSRHLAPADAASRPKPGRRAPGIRPEAGPTETLAFVAPQRRCRTCFGPMRSPDDGPATQTVAAAPKPVGISSAGASAVAADDPTSGPVDLGSGLIWYRLPARISGP